MVVNRQIRQLDSTMPRERTIKVFGIPENSKNETETSEFLEEKFKNFSESILHIQARVTQALR